MKKIYFIGLSVLLIFGLSCFRVNVKKNKGRDNDSHKECLDNCKRTKGPDRADCNRRCNR
ncbi:MAG: hypothetical protein OEZ13_09570 [Spirochaetia bacterium]|nr:hypothetical protein [Spirochaetia bacterium]